MKQKLTQLGIALLALVLIAPVAIAYNAPEGSPSTYNSDGPLTVGPTDQVKDGGLSVNAFQARGNAYFDQNVSFHGAVYGGTAAAPGPIVFGSTTNNVDLAINGASEATGTYQSDSLKNDDGNTPVCADKDGVFYLCSNGGPTGGGAGAGGTTHDSSTDVILTVPPPRCEVAGPSGTCVQYGTFYDSPVTFPSNTTSHYEFSVSSPLTAPFNISFKQVKTALSAVPYIMVSGISPVSVNGHFIVYPQYIMVTGSKNSNNNPCFNLTNPATGTAYTGNAPITAAYQIKTVTKVSTTYSSTYYATIGAGQTSMCDSTINAPNQTGGNTITRTVQINAVSPSTLSGRTVVY